MLVGFDLGPSAASLGRRWAITLEVDSRTALEFLGDEVRGDLVIVAAEVGIAVDGVSRRLRRRRGYSDVEGSTAKVEDGDLAALLCLPPWAGPRRWARAGAHVEAGDDARFLSLAHRRR